MRDILVTQVHLGGGKSLSHLVVVVEGHPAISLAVKTVDLGGVRPEGLLVQLPDFAHFGPRHVQGVINHPRAIQASKMAFKKFRVCAKEEEKKKIWATN